MNGEESPRPWRVAVYAQCPGLADVFDASGSPSGLVAGELKPTDAALIVAAVNLHEYLIEHNKLNAEKVCELFEERDRLRLALNEVCSRASVALNCPMHETEQIDLLVHALLGIKECARAALGEGETPTGKGVGE